MTAQRWEEPRVKPEVFEGPEAESITNNDATGRLLQILSFNFDLKTAAIAANRFCGYEIVDQFSHTQVEALTPALPEKAPDGTSLYGICGMIGIIGGVLTSRTVNLPLPYPFVLAKGWTWRATILNKQAGDTFPLFRLCVNWL